MSLRQLARLGTSALPGTHLFDPHAPYDPPEPERSVRRMAGGLEAAAEAYRRALELAPDDRTSALNLAAVYQELGEIERARQVRAHPR